MRPLLFILKMETKKIRQELEESARYWKKVFNWTYWIMAIIISLLVISFLHVNGKRLNLQEENQALKIELRKANWNNETLFIEYKCQDTKDIKFTKGQQGFWEFNDHGDYMNAKYVLNKLGCEVIE